MTANLESIIKLNHVAIYQNDFLVLNDVNFNLNRGEFVYIIGKTGCGKSSLLKTLYGELPLISGEASVAGFNLDGIRQGKLYALRRSLGIVFQDFQLLMDRTVIQNLEFVLKATGQTKKQDIQIRIHEVLTLVNMQDKGYKMPHQLSGGEQQRIVIARALLNKPKLILADEPTGNLDPDTTDEIMRLLVHINTNYNTSVLMATHNYHLIENFPNRIVKISNGKMIDESSFFE